MKVTPDSNCKRIQFRAEFIFSLTSSANNIKSYGLKGATNINHSLNSMKTFYQLLAITGLVTTSFVSQAAIYTLGSPVVNPANGDTYYLLSAGSWSDSEAFAQTLGGNLVTINNAAENQWVFNTFSALATTLTGNSDPSLWIGLYDPVLNDGSGAQHAADFVWADGEPVTDTDWYPGEPNNAGGVEYYASMRGPQDASPLASWNDLSNTGGGDAGGIYGVVEVVPEPQVYACFLVCVGVFMITRRKLLATR